MKKGFLITLIFVSYQLSAQILIPEFEKPTKLTIINDDKAEEIMPVPFNNGESMYFVRTYVEGGAKNRRKGQEVWSSNRTNGSWSEPTSTFEEVNDLGNNGVIGTSGNGEKVYIFNSIQTRRKLAKGIAFTEKNEEGEWSDLKKLEIKGFEVGEGYYSFYMNSTEDVLLISMAANDTTIKEDLFVSLKKDGKWSQVINLGPTINTSGFEISPFIAKDGKSLYFSSTGHGGEGDADIFVSYRQDESWTNWSNPLNLGSSINSSGFDAYFIIGNNKEVYFSSNRGQTYSDIYSTKITEKAIIANADSVSITAMFMYKGLPADSVKLGVYDAEGNLIDEVFTDAYGKFTYQKLNKDEAYFIKVLEENAEEYDESIIYILDNQGNKLERLVMLADGDMVPEKLIDDKELIQGVFKYENLPMQNAGLIVIDENGFPLDTIFTDEEGKFEYLKLTIEKNISLKPLDVEDVLLENIGLYLTDGQGNKTQTSEQNEGSEFKFVLTNKEDQNNEKKVSSSANQDTKDPVTEKVSLIKENKQPKKQNNSKSAVVPEGSEPSEILQFDFNSYFLDGDDWRKLHRVALKLRRNPDLNVLLVGHTDTSGTKKVNSNVSEQRAINAKNYLVKIGVSENRISVAAKDDTQPIASNTTREGRILNRRVEVFFK